MIRSDLALAALATAAVPGMRPVSVAAVRSGEENPLRQSALVEDVTGRTWVVRSPLSPAAGAELERNDDLIRHLGRHLPFKVPAAAGYADLGPDGRAAVYPYVEGRALNLRHLPVGPGLASAVGRAIAAVHNMPRELFEEFAVPVFDAREFRDRKLAELDRAAETGHVPNGLLARWEQALDTAPLWQFATVPTHGSLSGESFLVVFADESDAASGRVVGLTGWERAQVADPAEDFARLVEEANPRAVDAVFDSYSLARSQRPDGYLLSRARLASEMRLLSGLATAVNSGDEQFVRRRADDLRKLDRLTANDDSLIPRTAFAPTADQDTAVMDAEFSDVGAAPVADADWPADDTTVLASSPADAADVADGDAHDVVDGDADDVVDGEAAFEVEPPSDGAHLEPVTRPAGGTSAADVTAPIPMFRPVSPAQDDGAAPDRGTAGDGSEGGSGTQPSRDKEAEEIADAGATTPLPDRPRDAADEDRGATDEAEPTTHGQARPEATDQRAEPELTDQPGEPDRTAEEPDTTDEAEEPDGPGVPDEPVEPVATADESPGPDTTDEPAEPDPTTDEPAETDPTTDEATGSSTDERAEEQAAERAAAERLHTIYGMPDATDLGPPGSER